MRTITHLRRAIFAFTLFCLPAQSGAKILTFEALPEGTAPADNAPLLAPYTDGTLIVTFGFDTNGDFILDVPARFERRGPDTLFAYQTNLGDDADKTATQEGGRWLLRAPQTSQEGSPSGPLNLSQGAAFLVKYEGTPLPVSISGQVWDIDSGEQVQVDVFDASGGLIASTLSFVGPGGCCDGPTDGLPFTYSFSNLSAPVAAVRITETQGIPFTFFGFDNFTACTLDCATSFASTCSGPGWGEVGGLTPSAPHASVDAAGRVRLFARGVDNGIWQNIDAGGGFTGWTPVGGLTPDALAAVLDGANCVRLFARGTDDGIWQNRDCGGGFQGWSTVGGLTPSAPAVVIDAAGHVRLFARGVDNGIWQNIDPGNGFTGWAPLGGLTHTSVASVLDDNDDLHLYTRGVDQRVWENVLPAGASCGWTGLQPIRAGGLTPSGPAAVSDVSGVVRLFVQGTDAGIYEVDSQ